MCMYLIMAAVTTSYAAMSDNNDGHGEELRHRSPVPGDTYIVSFPSMSYNDSEALFVVSTGSIDSFLLVMATNKNGRTLGITDFLINRYTPRIIKRHGKLGAESGMIYFFVGSDFFRLIVVLVESNMSTASFLALPTKIWSKSYFLLAIKMASIHILTSMPTEVTLRLNFTLNDQSFKWNNQVYRSGEAIKYSFDNVDAHSFPFCGHESFSSIISVTVDASAAIGVILSNCRDKEVGRLCPKENSDNFVTVRPNGDIAAEMLLGENVLGKEYVTLRHSRWGTNTKYYVIAHHNNTTVTVTVDSNASKTLVDLGEWFVIEPDNEVAHIVSDQKVQVVFVLYSQECSSGLKEEIICQLVPTQMFFTRYHWLNWNTTRFTFDLLVVIKLAYISSLYLDAKRLQVESFKWSSVSGNSTWRVGQLTLSGNAHYILEKNRQPFGCYLHAKGLFSAAMNFAGLITHPCQPTTSSGSQNKFVDEDCDDVFDEEVENGIDDDFDLLIDEDINGIIPDVRNVPPKEIHINFSRGHFGRNGKFMCHCADGNCDSDGHCTTSTQCAAGWFGAKCQYRDLAMAAKPADHVFYDNDDNTCINIDMPEIIVRLSTSFFHSWVRLVFGNNDLADSFILTFLKDANKMIHESLPCTNVKVYRFSMRIIDLYCLDKELPLVVDIMVAWRGGDFLCSVHASGGRNIALHQPSLRMRDLPVRPESSAYAQFVVDGSKQRSEDSFISMSTFRYIDVKLNPMKYVQSLNLFSEISTNGSTITVELMDEYHNVRFTADVMLLESVHQVINTDPQLIVAIVRLKLTHGAVYMNEVEIFGDCAPPYYDIDCSSFCGLSCLHEKCNPQGMCFHCHPKKTGKFCDVASDLDQRIQEDSDNSSKINNTELVLGEDSKTSPLLYIVYMIPVLCVVPCIIIMTREGKVETIEHEDKGHTYVETKHWPSPELDLPPQCHKPEKTESFSSPFCNV